MGATLNDVRIRRKRSLNGCIIENYHLSSAHYIPNERFRQRGGSRGAISEMHGYTLSTDGCFRFHPRLITSRNYQETPLGACVLDSRAHEPVDQFFQNHLARDCL